ncbi:MAG: hypothetical protein PCFJNLEI_03639 [Verrucomicrobiae bacterium]|nr:hypothetical protein [Verrucomicrobiae bacterium]
MTDTNNETPTPPAPATPPKIGRRTKRTPFVTRKICRAIADGLPFYLAAAHAGVTGDTFRKWRNEFPEFNEAVEQAIAAGIKKRLNQIKKAGDEGDWKASAWWLEHVCPEHFARSRVDVAHIGKVEHSFSIPADVLDEIAAARKKQEEVRVDPDRA